MQQSTSNNMPVIIRLLASCVTLAKESATLIHKIVTSGDLKIIDKGINDFQTEADRSVQDLVGSVICHLFPKITVIGEEGTIAYSKTDTVTSSALRVLNSSNEVLQQSCPPKWQDLKEEDLTVWIDPLDGTSEFTQGFLDHVTVLIGISVGKMAIAGVIGQPYFGSKSNTESDHLGRCIWALEDLGLFGVEAKPLLTKSESENIIVTTRSHLTEKVTKTLENIKPSSVLQAGGCGNKVIMVLEGKAHAYIYPSAGCKKWDTCAPEVVLRAAGGVLTDVHGSTLQYDSTAADYGNRQGIVAVGKSEWLQDYINAIPQEVKDSLML